MFQVFNAFLPPKFVCCAFFISLSDLDVQPVNTLYYDVPLKPALCIISDPTCTCVSNVTVRTVCALTYL
jgi:hypothetical protein